MDRREQVDDTDRAGQRISDKGLRVFECVTNDMTGAYDGTFSICVAMCDGNRGIGLAGHHPWPALPTDFRYYMTLTGTPKDEGKLSVNIKGRITWEGSSDLEKYRRRVISIIISRTLKQPPDEVVESVFPSLQKAVEYLSTSAAFSSTIDSVWIMGGEDIYRDAINHPACRRIYLTRVYGTFPSDRFLAPFEDKFQQIEHDATVYEENGVKYRFEIYERKSR